MRDFLDEVLFPLVGFIAVIAVATALCLAVANELMRYQCRQYETITEKETRYSNFDNCYVKTANGFERWDEYTARAIANNLKEK